MVTVKVQVSCSSLVANHNNATRAVLYMQAHARINTIQVTTNVVSCIQNYAPTHLNNKHAMTE
jgi:hypothetical protein